MLAYMQFEIMSATVVGYQIYPSNALSESEAFSLGERRRVRHRVYDWSAHNIEPPDLRLLNRK